MEQKFTPLDMVTILESKQEGDECRLTLKQAEEIADFIRWASLTITVAKRMHGLVESFSKEVDGPKLRRTLALAEEFGRISRREEK